MLIVNGVIEGSWQRTINKNKVEIDIVPFSQLSKDKLKNVKKAIASYTQFVGGEIED
jgi:hypothetical protein